jgi:hypothetical protein
MRPTAAACEVLVEATALGPNRRKRLSDNRHTNQLARKSMAVIPVPESIIEIDGYDMIFGLPELMVSLQARKMPICK